MAILQYVQDYDELYPNLTTTAGAGGWKSDIYPYVKSAGVFTCPSNTTSTIALNQTAEIFGNCTAHYDMNPNVDGYDWINGLGFYGVPSAKIVAPTDTIAIAEIVGDGNGVSIRMDTASQGVGSQHWLFAGHTGRGNFAFCDGHVKALKWGQTVDPTLLWLPSQDINNEPGAFGIHGWGIGLADYQAVGAAVDAFYR